MIKIIFCCLNEEKSLKNLLQNLGKAMDLVKKDFEIIFCLDGTNDNSLKIIAEFQQIYKIKILPQINQRGLGIAYKRLFLEVLNNSNDDDLIISLDADNTHNPNQIVELLENFEQNSLDFLVASRFCGTSVMADFPIHRQLISKSTSLVLQNIFAAKKINGKKLQDYTSGYRIYKIQKLRELFKKEGNNFITEPEFTYTCELLIKLARINARLDEMPLSYDYGKKIGKSKLRVMRNFYRLGVMLKNLNRDRKTH